MSDSLKEMELIDKEHQKQMGELEVRCTELENLIKKFANIMSADRMEQIDDYTIYLLNKYLEIIESGNVNKKKLTKEELLMKKIEWIANRIEYYCLGNNNFNDKAQDEFRNILKVLEEAQPHE